MSRSQPGQRHGAHRTRRDVTAALVPAVLAVVLVTALIAAVNVWRAQDPAPQGDQDAVRAAASGASSRPATSAAATSASAPPSRSPRSRATASPSTGATGSTTAGDTRGTVAVVVLNQTARGGLAAAAADRLRARGWTVVATGSFRGVVPATTVYYPPGTEEQARAAAATLPVPPRIRPRFGNLSLSRLTVVVTAGYPA